MTQKTNTCPECFDSGKKIVKGKAVSCECRQPLKEENSHFFFKDLEIQEMPYDVTFHALHGLNSIDETEKLNLIIQDVLFKAEALFTLVSLVGNVFVGRNHRLNSEQMMNCLDSVGQVGVAMVSSLHTPIEELLDLIEKSEVKDNA